MLTKPGLPMINKVNVGSTRDVSDFLHHEDSSSAFAHVHHGLTLFNATLRLYLAT